MDFKQIQELIKMINKSNIGEVTIEEKGFKVTIKQKEEPVQQVIAAPAYAQAPAPQFQAAPPAAGSAGTQAPASKTPEATAADNYLTIKSPMIGTFYRSSGPGKPSFVE